MRTTLQLTLLALITLPRLAMGQSTPTQSDVLEQALGGVVTVAIYQNDENGSQLLGTRGSSENPNAAYARALNLSGARGSGSGFVVEQGGQKYVITNAHVVESAADAAGSIAVFSINQKKYPVRVVGGDALYDFAVLAFTTPPGPELSALVLRPQPARIGERVYAIGNPQGEYPYTVTDGIVSAKNRARGGLTGKYGFLQTTATVIWGNSGGPLVDERGQVLGINSQIAFADAPDGSQIWLSQINFALETPIVQRLLTDVLTNDGLVRRAYLGLEISQQTRTAPRDSRPDGREERPRSQTTDPVLSAILPDSPAKAALSGRVGQRIVAVNGEEVRSVEEVLGTLETVRPGSTVTLTFQPEGGANQDVAIRAGTLSPVQLESIARYVLASTRLSFTDVPGGGLAVQMTPDENTYEMTDDRKFKKIPAKFLEQKEGRAPADASATTKSSAAAGNVRIVAAGLHSERGSKLWRVNKLSYLGAVCRLMGLTGVVDLAFADPTDAQNVRFARKLLSGQEGVVKACLWY
ncbi:S1C family serine protease [Fibrella sp. WM1]|uniref:S1C family serine protease n=1 Tax=Fibrella musci TaxID=3242485 RepID=UPI003522711D